jgi:hypothetical protein
VQMVSTIDINMIVHAHPAYLCCSASMQKTLASNTAAPASA